MKNAMAGVEMFGATLASFAQACVNLNILAGGQDEAIFHGYEINRWYPVERYLLMDEFIGRQFPSPAPIHEKIGREFMRIWHQQGPGRFILERGVDYLYFQTTNQGYKSVVRGDSWKIGRFVLTHLDEAQGRAVIESTTPYNKDFERGVIAAGLTLPGDLIFVNVDNSQNSQVFEIEFH